MPVVAAAGVSGKASPFCGGRRTAAGRAGAAAGAGHARRPRCPPQQRPRPAGTRSRRRRKRRPPPFLWPACCLGFAGDDHRLRLLRVLPVACVCHGVVVRLAAQQLKAMLLFER